MEIEEENFYHAFVVRTQQELGNYHGPQEFTNLINSTFGLIIVPYESHIKQSRQDEVWNTPINNIWTEENRPFIIVEFEPIGHRNNATGRLERSDKTLKILIEKIRNGLAHSNLVPVNQNGTWTGILIWNCTKPIRRTDEEAERLEHCDGQNQEEIRVKDLIIGFTWEQLHTFANFIATNILDN